MNDNWEYFNIELVYNNEVINVNSIPKIVFDSGAQPDLEVSLNEIFGNMITETLRLGDPTIPTDCSVWESTNIYLSHNEERINVVNKTKTEMQQYSSYGEGLFSIYNEITQS